MKKVILALAIATFSVSSIFAQAVPAAAAAVKAAPAAAAAVKAAPAAAAAAAQAPAAAATTEVKKAVKKVKKAHASVGAATTAAAAGSGKMTHTCSKGCAVLVDGAGAKCPKCGGELVAVGAKADAAKKAPAAVKEEAKKM